MNFPLVDPASQLPLSPPEVMALQGHVAKLVTEIRNQEAELDQANRLASQVRQRLQNTLDRTLGMVMALGYPMQEAGDLILRWKLGEPPF